MADKKHWMQGAVKHMKKGALRKELGIKGDKKIPESTLEKDASKPGILGKRARLALAFRHAKHKK